MFVGSMAAAVALLLAAEYRGWRAGIWTAKPLASTVFLVAALYWGALDSSYGRLVLAALALSWLGDVLLIPANRPAAFHAGIGAFASRGLDPMRMELPAAVAALGLVFAVPWLRPRIPRELRLAVYVYMGILSLMLVFGAGASGADSRILVGAALFYVSDLSVARDRFVAPGFANGLVGLPLYYAAQLVLAATVGVSSPD